jgi:hypothetical protein
MTDVASTKACCVACMIRDCNLVSSWRDDVSAGHLHVVNKRVLEPQNCIQAILVSVSSKTTTGVSLAHLPHEDLPYTLLGRAWVGRMFSDWGLDENASMTYIGLSLYYQVAFSSGFRTHSLRMLVLEV